MNMFEVDAYKYYVTIKRVEYGTDDDRVYGEGEIKGLDFGISISAEVSQFEVLHAIIDRITKWFYKITLE